LEELDFYVDGVDVLRGFCKGSGDLVSFFGMLVEESYMMASSNSINLCMLRGDNDVGGQP
jgi:hypothetical protein